MQSSPINQAHPMTMRNRTPRTTYFGMEDKTPALDAKKVEDSERGLIPGKFSKGLNPKVKWALIGGGVIGVAILGATVYRISTRSAPVDGNLRGSSVNMPSYPGVPSVADEFADSQKAAMGLLDEDDTVSGDPGLAAVHFAPVPASSDANKRLSGDPGFAAVHFAPVPPSSDANKRLRGNTVSSNPAPSTTSTATISVAPYVTQTGPSPNSKPLPRDDPTFTYTERVITIEDSIDDEKQDDSAEEIVAQPDEDDGDGARDDVVDSDDDKTVDQETEEEEEEPPAAPAKRNLRDSKSKEDKLAEPMARIQELKPKEQKAKEPKEPKEKKESKELKPPKEKKESKPKEPKEQKAPKEKKLKSESDPKPTKENKPDKDSSKPKKVPKEEKPPGRESKFAPEDTKKGMNDKRKPAKKDQDNDRF